MPELPEVETVRRGLAEHLVGRPIGDVSVHRDRAVRRTSADAVINGLRNTTLLAAQRRGKYLLCPLDSGDTLMVHLRMSGQLLIAPAGSPRPAHTHVVAELLAVDDCPAAELWFVDPRTFGEVVVFDPDNVAVEVPELTQLGFDPIVDDWDDTTLAEVLAGRSTAMKALLLDQHRIAGIGNIYADEILHQARLHPETPAGSLRRRDVARLAASIRTVLAAAIAAGGSTLVDARYVDLLGMSGWYQDEHHVYGRAGERCLTCGRGVIRRIVRAGRSTHFCPVCQRPRTLPSRVPPRRRATR